MESPPHSEDDPGDPGTSPPTTAGAALRASDADRERAAAAVHGAAADDRDCVDELDSHQELVCGATPKDELAPTVKELQPTRWANATPTSTKDAGIINNFARQGHWVVGDTYRATAVISTGVVDLREAQFTGPETTIHVNSWFGTVYIVVPDDAEVQVAGTGILGGFKHDSESTEHSAAHRITVTGLAVCGSVYAVHQPPSATKRRLQKHKRKNAGSN
jgi:hypothetical protein